LCLSLGIDHLLLPPPRPHLDPRLVVINLSISKWVLSIVLSDLGVRYRTGDDVYDTLQAMARHHQLNGAASANSAYQRLTLARMHSGPTGLATYIAYITECVRISQSYDGTGAIQVTDAMMHEVLLAGLDPVHLGFYTSRVQVPGSTWLQWVLDLETHSVRMRVSESLAPPIRMNLSRQAGVAGVAGVAGGHPSGVPSSPLASGPLAPDSTRPRLCFRCAQPGHIQTACTADPRTLRCGGCNQSGHVRHQCPTLRARDPAGAGRHPSSSPTTITIGTPHRVPGGADHRPTPSIPGGRPRPGAQARALLAGAEVLTDVDDESEALPDAAGDEFVPPTTADDDAFLEWCAAGTAQGFYNPPAGGFSYIVIRHPAQAAPAACDLRQARAHRRFRFQGLLEDDPDPTDDI
jgi:hypothetical protein